MLDPSEVNRREKGLRASTRKIKSTWTPVSPAPPTKKRVRGKDKWPTPSSWEKNEASFFGFVDCTAQWLRYHLETTLPLDLIPR
jgi:hypothetical protein